MIKNKKFIVNGEKYFLEYFPFWKHRLVLACILGIFIISCGGKNPKEKEISSAIKQGDPLQIAIVCADYKGEKLKKECEDFTSQAEGEIQNLISKRKELPFFKLMVEPEKNRKIRELLVRNIYLGIKYRTIWEEITEKTDEEFAN